MTVDVAFAVSGTYCSLECCFIVDDENCCREMLVGGTAEVQKPWFLLPYIIVNIAAGACILWILRLFSVNVRCARFKATGVMLQPLEHTSWLDCAVCAVPEVTIFENMPRLLLAVGWRCTETSQYDWTWSSGRCIYVDVLPRQSDAFRQRHYIL